MYNAKMMFSLFSLVATCMFVGACAKSSSSSNSTSSGTVFKAPAVAPVVNAALPTSLKATKATISSYSYQPKVGEPGVTYHQEYRKFFNTEGLSQFGTPASTKYSPLATVTVNNQNSTVAKSNIGYLFSLSFNDINNGSVMWQGFLNNQVVQIDERMKDGAMSVAMPCLSNTAKSYTIDLSGIDPMLNFTLGQMQCYGAMGSDTTGATTGGMAFGQQGTGCQTVASTSNPVPGASPLPMSTPTPFTPGNVSGGCNFSLMLSLVGLNSNFTNSGGFLVAANLQNAGSTNDAAPEYVDAMSISYSPASQNNSTLILRFRAVPSLNTFEMFYGSNVAGISNADAQHWAYLGYGFRMISDGVHIYADGHVYDSGGTSTWLPFNVCLNAADNSVVDLTVSANQTECNALANSFSLSTSGKADINYYEITGVSTSTTVPGPTAAASGTTASAAVIQLLSGAYNVSNISSSAAKTF